MSMCQAIESYILAKDGNRPHLLSKVFNVDALLVMNVKTKEITFPSVVKGLFGISDTLVSQFAQRYENVYTFCIGEPPMGSVINYNCGWLVCMSEKESGAVRIGYGEYEWVSDSITGLISKLVITIEDMSTLPSECGGAVFEWAKMRPYPWVSQDLEVPSLLNLRVLQDAMRFHGGSGKP